MLRSVKDLIGYPAVARDGKAGKVRDLLFGDRNWRARFIEVDTRKLFRFNWHYISEPDDDAIESARYLVPTARIGVPTVGSERHVAPLQMDKDEVKACPPRSAEPTVEEQLEAELSNFLGHAAYGERPLIPTAAGMIGYEPPVAAYQRTDAEIEAHRRRIEAIAGEHLHSAKTVMGYGVRTGAQILGRVSDFIVDVDKWQLAYLVLDTRQGIPSRKYLLEMSEVRALDWSTTTVDVDLGGKELPERRRYWSFDPVNRDEAGDEYDYYGRRCGKTLKEEYY